MPPRPPRAAGLLDRVLAGVSPASGAAVMGTGIVSIGLGLDGQETLSRLLAGLDAALWVLLGVLLPVRAARDRERFRADVRSPAALTAIAGTGVLGTRLAIGGWSWAGDALLLIALGLWLGLVPTVLRSWRAPTVGVSFVLTVATESLALLAIVLAHAQEATWLLHAALVPFALGLLFYAFVFARFDFHQLAVGHGDHWVIGGALAISTVAAGRLVIAAEALGAFGGALDALRDLALALWAITAFWLPLLLVAEARWPRWHYDVRRWSTVFPVGMYAACSFVVGEAAGVAGISDFARGWVWVGLVVWVIVFLAMLRRVRETLSGDPAVSPAKM